MRRTNSRPCHEFAGEREQLIRRVYAFCQAGLTALAFSTPLDAQTFQSEILRWEVQGTVVDMEDPTGLFPSVRLGDQVRGTLKFDATLWPHPLYSRPPRFFSYTNETWMDVASMVIETSQGDLALQKDVHGEFADVDVANDWFFEDDGEVDFVQASQSVKAPPGFTGDAPVVIFLLYGEPAALTDAELPRELDLNDWFLAALSFRDFFAGDVNGTYIDAEIYSITPVFAEPLVGDFDHDGDVDGEDGFGWMESFDSALDYADGNGDRLVDGHDFLLWQRNLGSTSLPTSAAVPEPTFQLWIGALLGPVSLRVLTARQTVAFKRSAHPSVDVRFLGWRRSPAPRPTADASKAACRRNENGILHDALL